MLSKIPSILISICLLLSSNAFAQKIDKNTYDSIAKSLSEKVPNLPKIDEIQLSAVSGIYEVRHSGAEINGTPTLIFEDGTKVPGVMSVAKIEEKLKQTKK